MSQLRKYFIRPLWWLALNGGVAYCGYLGVNGNRGAANVYLFSVFVSAFVWCFVVAAKEEPSLKKTLSHGRSVPAFFSSTLDLVSCGYLIWHSWWFTGIAVLVSWMCESAIFSESKKDKE